MAALRSRGVTRMLDLNVVNRQRLEHVESEEEGEDLEQEEEEDAQPPLQRRRLDAPAGAPQVASPPRPTGDTDMVEVDDTAEYSPTSPAHSQHQQQAEEPQAPESLALPPERPTPEPLAEVPDAELPAVPPSAPPTPSQNEPSEEPSPPPSTAAARIPVRPPAPTLDPATAALYQVPQPGETFQLLRNRFDQQETISFGNRRARTFPAPTEHSTEHASSQAVHGAGPYDKPATGSDPLEGCSFELDDLDNSLLPPGWHIEDGYITLDAQDQDYWELRAGCLIRHHLVPRRTEFCPQFLGKHELQHLPLPLDRLDDVRITVQRSGKQLRQESDFIQNGSGKPSQQTWMTIFQVNGETRKEMGMTSHDVQDARQLGRKQRAAANKKIQKNKSEIKERELSLEHRLLFQAAKQKELSSFFQDGVWSFQTTKEASPKRTLTSRMLLKWSKNADGSPRAKARLVVRGYADVDALAGSLETASPASTRLGKTLFLSLSSCLGWTGWSADVSTAFLQGLPQERKLWVKLPPDALALLGADSDTRMFLHKPVYGQLDAPRRWFFEASSRIRKLGRSQHSLDPCFWMLFEPQSQKLVGLLCLHVDDMLGGGDLQSETYQHMEEEIKTMFNFRTWQQDESFEYCGADMSRETDGTWVVSHEKYLQKIKPLTMEKGRPTHSPMTPKEQSLLRGLLGSLQWPAVQSSPHWLASTSLLSGEMSTGLAAPMFEANRLLKFAKQNSDCVLKYPPLGELGDLRLSCMFDTWSST